MNTAGLSSIVIALGLFAAGAAGAATSRTNGACFARANINGFNAPNDHTLYLRVGVNEIYRLDLMNACTGLSFRQGIGLENRPASPWICTPLEATVVYRSAGIGQRCPVTAIHRLTPDEVKALPKRDLP
jgi:hypothetical protein